MIMKETVRLTSHDLGDDCHFLTGRLPDELVWNADLFERIWQLHPEEKHWIMMHGHLVQTPRWQQAFGADYEYTGNVNRAAPVPPELEPLLAWVQATIDARFNGILNNYYEGPDHYIGPHHDSTKNMVTGAPIVTVSFGETRVFRLTLEKVELVNGKRKRVVERTIDFPAPNGTVFVEPYATNEIWKHGVPKSARYTGRRISVTFRAFEVG